MSELSPGAAKLYQLLKRTNYVVKTEYLFKDLKGFGGKSLRYDFALLSKNYQPIALIEYDSNLHFQFSPFYHKTRKNFLAAQERDRKKNSYALAHSIPLYRIPYWEIDKIQTPADIFNEKNLVKNRFHNDLISKRR